MILLHKLIQSSAPHIPQTVETVYLGKVSPFHAGATRHRDVQPH